MDDIDEMLVLLDIPSSESSVLDSSRSPNSSASFVSSPKSSHKTSSASSAASRIQSFRNFF